MFQSGDEKEKLEEGEKGQEKRDKKMGKDSAKTKKQERKKIQKTYKDVKKKCEKSFKNVFGKKLPEVESQLEKELENVVRRLQDIIDDIRGIPEFQTSAADQHKHDIPYCSPGQRQPSQPEEPRPDYNDENESKLKQPKHIGMREDGAKFMRETEEPENLKQYHKKKGRVEQKDLEEAKSSMAHFQNEKLEHELKGARTEIKNLNKKINSLEKNQNDFDEAKFSAAKFKKEKEELEAVLEQEKNRMIRQLDKFQKELDNQKTQVNKLASEKKEALTRLSELAGRQLLDNNPNIADLSTEIRPTKIGENFMQVYDNEWTDAFEELQQNGKEDKQCIEILLKIVQEAFKYATAKAHDFEAEMILIINSCSANRTRETIYDQKNKRSQTAENLTKEELGLIRQLKKASAVRTKTSIQNDFVTEKKLPEGPKIQMFSGKCVEMCWYMAIQTPPMALMFDMKHMHPFDEKYYKKYMTSGDIFDFLVWPCILLHKDGPVVAKGIAEATTTDVAQTETPVTAANDTRQQNQVGDSACEPGRGYGNEIKTAEEFLRSVKSGDRGNGEMKSPPLPREDISKKKTNSEKERSDVKTSFRENIPSGSVSEQNKSKISVTKISVEKVK